jgi:hypothetical protein
VFNIAIDLHEPFYFYYFSPSFRFKVEEENYGARKVWSDRPADDIQMVSLVDFNTVAPPSSWTLIKNEFLYLFLLSISLDILPTFV